MFSNEHFYMFPYGCPVLKSEVFFCVIVTNFFNELL